MLARLLARARTFGFEGATYSGVIGKLRFIAETVLWHEEIVFVATAYETAASTPARDSQIEFVAVANHAELARFAADFDAGYFPGCTAAWKAPFTWGERAMVGVSDGKGIAIAWVQCGTPAGFPTYYGPLLEGEARVLRVGVVPASRRRGVNTQLLQATVRWLITEGAVRVFIDCHAHNLPSIRSFLRVGFLPIAMIKVFELPWLRGFVRWKDLTGAAAVLEGLCADLGIPCAPRRVGVTDADSKNQL